MFKESLFFCDFIITVNNRISALKLLCRTFFIVYDVMFSEHMDFGMKIKINKNEIS